MSMETTVPTLGAYLEEPLRVGEPAVAGPLAVFPLFGPEAQFEYQSFAQGSWQGVTIKELHERASVSDLVVANPTWLPVLLFEGEEVLGAQQNRTFDVSVVVAPRTTRTVPVSCVEANRWDASRHDEQFAPAPQTAYPSLRRLKNQSAHAQVVQGAEARADQSAVWQEVDQKLDVLAVSAPTRAMHDGFEQHRSRISELTRASSLESGQTGMLVAIAGEFRVLDHVSRPEVLASLFEPLVQGYALDAIGCQSSDDPPGADDAVAFVNRVAEQPILERDSIGLGRDVRLMGSELTGAGLVCDGELVQMSVFAGGSARNQAPHGGRIRRPSRRRH
jgi:hypothetical protein